MTPTQIEGFIDRICGLYPSSQVSLTKAKHAWTADDFLLYQSVDDARKVIPLIMEYSEKFPSLKEVHRIFKMLRKPETEQAKVVCKICDGNGWDTGERWNQNTNERICEPFTKIVFGLTYSYVIACECREFKTA